MASDPDFQQQRFIGWFANLGPNTYDTLERQAIEDEFVARGMLGSMRQAYWNFHAGRRLHFHSGGSTITFNFAANRVYTAVSEWLLQRAKRRLIGNKRPSGLPIASEHSWSDVEERKTGNRPFKEGDLFAMNSADDTYVLGRGARDTTYTLAVIRREYAAKSQAISSDAFAE